MLLKKAESLLLFILVKIRYVSMFFFYCYGWFLLYALDRNYRPLFLFYADVVCRSTFWIWDDSPIVV